MPNQIIQLGVVGCGWAGCQAISAANATSRLKVVAIAERDPILREQARMTIEYHTAMLTIMNSLTIMLLMQSISRLLQMVGFSKYWIPSMLVSMF